MDIVLIFLYSGFRITELFKIKTEDIDLDQMTFKGGIKTKAGKNRIVPIHSLIEPIVRKYISEGGKYFLTVDGKHIQSATYREYYWKPVMEYLKMNHTPQ